MRIFITRILLGLAHLLSELAFKLMPRARAFVNAHNVVETLEPIQKPAIHGLRSKVRITNKVHIVGSRTKLKSPVKRLAWD